MRQSPYLRIIRSIFFGLAIVTSIDSSAGDFFNVIPDIRQSANDRIAAGVLAADECLRPMDGHLSIGDALNIALCSSPKTRSAWASVREAASVVGQGKAAYLPTVQASAQRLRESVRTDVRDAPALRSAFTNTVDDDTISLSWLLYDFGGRSAALQNTKELLIAAEANEASVMQTVFLTTSKDYYSAQATRAKMDATSQIEAFARQSLEAATARVAHGVAPVTDELQSKTALAQAVFDHGKASGDYRGAMGALAIDLSMSPDAPIEVDQVDLDTTPGEEFSSAVDKLIVQAKRDHPKILAAEAQWKAALAKLDEIRAQGRPTVKLVGEATRSSQPISASLGQPELPALTNERYIGIQVDVPIFTGFAHTYQVAQASAQESEQFENMRDVEQQVAANVWSSYQALRTSVESLKNTSTLVESARESFNAAEHRYRSGVGNILELLNSQTALSAAQQQQISAQSDWRSARLQLAASLGRLGMWSISDTSG